MSIRLAEEVPDRIAFMNGSADGLMPFDGGAMANGATVLSSDETVARYAAAADGAPVVFNAVDGGGHNEPSLTEELVGLSPRRAPQNRDIEMAEEVWRFFSELGS